LTKKEIDDPIEIDENMYRKACCLSPKIVDSHRIGTTTNKKRDQSLRIRNPLWRPIRVEVEHPALVQVLQQAAHELRISDFSSVYLAPNRCKEELAINSSQQ
jgi:hypothetical protein